MQAERVRRLLGELRKMPILDPHTHVAWQRPVAQHLGELLGYHYYTELVNSSRGRPEALPEDPAARVAYVWPRLAELRGTVQFDWFLGLSETFLHIPRGDWFTRPQEELVKRAQAVIEAPEYAEQIWQRSGLKEVYLTNAFDENCSGLRDPRLVPCLRTDDLVFNLVEQGSVGRLEQTTGLKCGQGLEAFERVLSTVFDRYAAWKMGYAACSFPPRFEWSAVGAATALPIWRRIAGGERLDAESRAVWSCYAVECIAAQCRRVGAPFCLMSGVDRSVYPEGVPQGRDLFRADNHLRGFDGLLNAYSEVRFPFMVLSDTAGQELTASGWIRHNVYPFSHWWYSVNPIDIRRELRRRLDVLPRNKFIGFHSDGYSLEFVLPKFNTYRLQLAIVLAERIEESELGGPEVLEPFGEDDALALAQRILVTNPKEILGLRA